ncbi:MAG: type III-B CRISPR module-associated Cmr3 family protein, partial [Thermoanaerobaculum sp.]|nr:type III-B CRISPR module-associated Cmr3 family protein [Thermoanaerobaculum sp.]
MTSVWLFLEPLDVLYLRGNAAFGGPGDHAEALMPPWPSVFSGALRSALLARGGVDLGRFTDEAAEHTDDRLRRVLGTPSQPGNFRLSAALLARWQPNTNSYEPFFPLPQDLLVFEQPPGEKDSKGRGELSEGPSGKLAIVRLRPQVPGEAFNHVQHSGLTPNLLVVYGAERGKPRRSWWLTPKGWDTYLSGGTPAAEDLVSTSDLWSYEFRLGIARSRETYTVEEGRIYTTQAVAVKSGVGFLVGVEGCPEELFHGLSLVRLGGDGRGASVRLVQGPPWPDP